MPSRISDTRSRSPRPPLRHQFNQSGGSSFLPLWRSRRKHPGHSSARRIRGSPRVLILMSGGTAVIVTVTLLSLVAAVMLGLSAWQCAAPDSIPSIDSNFFSTISQASTGIASLYCIVVPLLRTGEIPVKQEKVFRTLLWTSAAMSTVSIIVYPWQIQTSMVFAFLASIAQVIATLQLVRSQLSEVFSLEEYALILHNLGRRRKWDHQQLKFRR